MTAKAMLAMAVLGALALAGCTGGSDNDGSSSSTSASGGAGAGGCVTVGGSGGCSNATVSGSGSASYSSTGSNSTTNTTTGAPMNGTVSIQQGDFHPDEITVRVGGTVTWEHHDGATAHTVTADDNSFDSSPSCSTPLPVGDCMMDGDTFEHTFTTAGDVKYHDKLNTQLTGVVHVVA
jgi:plastocyanin